MPWDALGPTTSCTGARRRRMQPVGAVLNSVLIRFLKLLLLLQGFSFQKSQARITGFTLQSLCSMGFGVTGGSLARSYCLLRYDTATPFLRP